MFLLFINEKQYLMYYVNEFKIKENCLNIYLRHFRPNYNNNSKFENLKKWMNVLKLFPNSMTTPKISGNILIIPGKE